MTHPRDYLDLRDYDDAPNRAHVDHDLIASDREAVLAALRGMTPPPSRLPALLWAIVMLGLLLTATWPLWEPVLAWMEITP